MNNNMEWFFKLIRVAGASFPGASSFVQLQAELDSERILARVVKLEDPISYLHDDVACVSNEIYKELSSKDTINLDFEEAFYIKYSRVLAVLDSKGLISKKGAIAAIVPIGIWVTDPSYIIYMCALFEDKIKMQHLYEIVDQCESGKWLSGEEIRNTIDLPLPVIKAVFDIYESNGFGLCSKELGSCVYMSNT